MARGQLDQGIKASMLTPKDQRLDKFWANHSARAGSDQLRKESACRQSTPPATPNLRSFEFGWGKMFRRSARGSSCSVSCEDSERREVSAQNDGHRDIHTPVPTWDTQIPSMTFPFPRLAWLTGYQERLRFRCAIV